MQRYLALVLAVWLALWLVSLPPGSLTLATPGNYWALRGTLILGTGYLAIGCMSVVMILAARPVRLERLLGGLDQFYRLHKGLGIAGVLFGVAHWLLEILPKWMVGQGWLARIGLGRLPGDFSFHVGGREWFVPLASSLLLSLAALVIWRHKDNIARIIAGTEPKIGKK